MRTPTAFAILAAALAAQPPADSTALRAALARAMKVVPVPDLVSPLPPPPGLPLGSLIGFGAGEVSVLSASAGTERVSVRVEDLPGLLRALTPLPWSDAGASVDQVGDSLILTGAPDQLHMLEQSLARIDSLLGAPARLQAALFAADRLDGIKSRGDSFAEAFARLQQQCGRPLWQGSTTAYPNQIVELGVRRLTPYVADCDVEIAQSSTMANPVVRGVDEGTRLQVEVHALAGSSDLVLFCQFALGEQLAMHSVELGPDRTLPTLQAPEVAITLGSMSGRIRSGGALALQVSGELAGRCLVLLVGAERPPVAPELQRELGLWPLSAFLSPALRNVVRPVATDETLAVGGDVPVSMYESPVPAIDPAEPELWRQLLALALGEGQADLIGNGMVVVRGDAAARQIAARLVETYQDQFLVDAEVELETRAEAGPALRTVRFPALLGRSQFLVHGVETTMIADADVEVAQKAGISDPKVRRQFDGMVASVRVYPTRGRELGAEVAIELSASGPRALFAPGTEKGVTLHQAAASRSRFAHRGGLPKDGAAVDLGAAGDATVARERVRIHQTLAVRPR